MRIVCPACAAKYDVPEGRIPPGRMVRCARCATDWAPIPAAVPSDLEHEALQPWEAHPSPEIVDHADAVADDEAAGWEPLVPSATERYAVSSSTKQVMALRAAWALSAVVLLAAAWLAYSARESVMQAWPPSVRAYAALGLVRQR